MTRAIAILATILAAAFAIAAFVALSMERQVLSGTLFLFTAFSIYIRESYK
jgi:hypothetical protein